MMPSKQTLERLREQYKRGTRIELIRMEDPFTKLKPGDRGSVMFVDDIGTIHCQFDCGSCLGIVYGVDACRIIEG